MNYIDHIMELDSYLTEEAFGAVVGVCRSAGPIARLEGPSL
ncbi:MAG: hypothetical protein ACREN8_08040 [Candidatus Dormibacteraceae bacterium]